MEFFAGVIVGAWVMGGIWVGRVFAQQAAPASLAIEPKPTEPSHPEDLSKFFASNKHRYVWRTEPFNGSPTAKLHHKVHQQFWHPLVADGVTVGKWVDVPVVVEE